MSNNEANLSIEPKKNSSSPLHRDDTRNFKGYYFEIFECKPMIDAIPNIKYECNPTNYEDWKRQHWKNPYDAVVTLPNGDKIHLEMKFRADGEKVYHNWFNRDWLTRDADIYVTNNVEAIGYWDKRTLNSKGKKLLSLSEAAAYISGLMYRILHPNQYVYWNSLITKIITIIRALFSEITSEFNVLRVKVRLKGGLLGDKTSVRARFHALQSKFFSIIRLKSINKKIHDKANSLREVIVCFLRYVLNVAIGLILKIRVLDYAQNVTETSETSTLSRHHYFGFRSKAKTGIRLKLKFAQICHVW